MDTETKSLYQKEETDRPMSIDFTNPKPLYLQIVESIKAKISSGQLHIGDQISSHSELALHYGVSLITVKKALNELIRQGLLYSRIGKGTFVAQPPASVDFNRTIGLMLSDLKNPFFSLILHSIEQKISENGYNLLLSNASRQMEKEESRIQQFQQLGVDGMIIASTSHIYRATETIRRLKHDHFPFVMVSFVADEDIYYVGTDHELGAFMATEHLIRQGYERIGYISGERGNLLADLRQQGYRRALTRYQRPFRPEFIFPLPMKFRDFESGYKIGKRFFQSSEFPDALFVYNDLSALGFETAVLEQGYKIPDDVAIIGFDDIEQGRYAPVPLTTIHQPTEEIGRMAFEKLSKLIKKEPVEIRTILKPQLIVRETCKRSRNET
ncbi:GntR family transcriptional regulator [candidate division KSB1 bacterium]|nr:GntR family transcriptional regulator [candidate division KSB1 bacterium]